MDQQLQLNKRMRLQAQSGIQLGKGIIEWPSNDEFFDMIEIAMKCCKLVSFSSNYLFREFDDSY
jgi:hypothetical protein